MTLRASRSAAFLVLAGAALSSGMAFADTPPDGRTNYGRGSHALVMDLTDTTRARQERAVGPESGATLEAAPAQPENLAQTQREPFRETRDAPFKVIDRSADPAPIL